MPRVTDEYAAFRRRQILSAAWEAFAERGYRETTMRDIAASLGLSTGTVYSYFESKDEIIDALKEASLRDNRQLRERLAAKETVNEALEELFGRLTECCSEEDFRRAARANVSVWAEALRRETFREAVVDVHEKLRSGLAALARDGVARGELAADLDPTVFTGLVTALVLGLQAQAALIGGSSSPEYRKQLRELLMKGLAPQRDGEKLPEEVGS
jgi:AcrR family transcriptional regulator